MGLSALLQSLVEEREPFPNVVPLNIVAAERRSYLAAVIQEQTVNLEVGTPGTPGPRNGVEIRNLSRWQQGYKQLLELWVHMEYTFSVVSCQCALRHMFTPALSRCRADVDITPPVLIA